MRGGCLVVLGACTLLGCRFDRGGLTAGPAVDAGHPLSDAVAWDRAASDSSLLDGGSPDLATGDQAPNAAPRVLKLAFKNKSRNEALVGFVVLVTLTPLRFDYQAADPAGADLRFVDGLGAAPLPHEIERWTPGGTSTVWVRVPQIDAASDTDFIVLHYGDPNNVKPQDPNAVWADHLAVYHLADDPGQQPPQIRDSSPSAFHGVAKGGLGVNSRIDGAVGGALTLKASQGDFVEIGDKAPLHVAPGQARTLQVWFRTATTSTKAYTLQNETFCQGWGLGLHDNGEVLGRLALGPTCSGYTSHHLGSWGTGYADTSWHHAAFVIDRSKGTATLFVDGKQMDSESINTTLSYAGGVTKIGSNWNDSATFDGAIDEVRVGSGARSADWIDAEYASMTDGLLDYILPP